MSDGFPVSFELREDVTAALDALARAGVELRTPMKDIAGHLADTTRDRFETQTSPAGVPWKKSERAIADGGQTLVDSGDLLASIAERWGDDFAEAGPEASGGGAVYAGIHQDGGTIRAKNGKALSFAGRLVASVTIPKREYVGFTDENADYAVATLAGHLARAMSAGGAAA